MLMKLQIVFTFAIEVSCLVNNLFYTLKKFVINTQIKSQ